MYGENFTTEYDLEDLQARYDMARAKLADAEELRGSTRSRLLRVVVDALVLHRELTFDNVSNHLSVAGVEVQGLHEPSHGKVE